MCGPYHEEITERQQLERAIERLEKREWCPDAMIALRAAKAHLATLPRTERTVWWACWPGGESGRVLTRKEAMDDAEKYAPPYATVQIKRKTDLV
jgi:uncharacterized protein (DUF849 family)